MFSSKENAFVIYKDLKKEAENPAQWFTLEQEVADMMTNTLSSVVNYVGKLSMHMKKLQIHFPWCLKNINGWRGFTPWIVYCFLVKLISHRYKYPPGLMSQTQKLKEFN